MSLEPHETKLCGKWRVVDGKVVEDEVCKRIRRLTADSLVRIATDASGWDILFQDPADGRYWELTHPSSGSHGGGPPCLQTISETEAKTKYDVSRQ